jgi:glycerol-3-phosphate dehydrogenase (NAD(P)+)
MVERIAVVGGGSWGATLADHLARRGHAVALWEFDARRAHDMARTRRLSTLPALDLHSAVEVSSDLAATLRGRPMILCAVPSAFVRATFRRVRETGALADGAWAVSVTKGLEANTLKRMSEIIGEEAPALAGRTAVLSGPSHAEEVAQRMPSALVTAGPDAFPARVQELFNADHFRVYTSHDFIGVELGGAFKNIYAIGCGVVDGLGLGDNTKAALMTRGLNEMTRLGLAAGALGVTFFGLSGLGDLIVTCMSRHSRNRLLGEKIGSGKTPAQALGEMTMVAEGYDACLSARQLCRRHNLDLPIIHELYACLYEGKPAREALRDLLNRPPAAEMGRLESSLGSA